MSNVYDDRRQEPRFPTNGKYQFDASSDSGRIFDLSLNGAMLERLPNQKLFSGDRQKATLSFPGETVFTVELVIVHVGHERIGVEFYDIDPQNFAALAHLIDLLLRATNH